MSYTFRRAVREQVPLIIGISGGTGSGKTFSAMRMAKGMSHGKPFCVIDTENGRASHYADQFAFDVLDLRAPFTPDAYAQAIAAADKAGYPVVVVDSMSHVWAGDGGVLDWQEHELERMAGADYQRRESCKMAAWIKPKMAHKHMMQTLLQVQAHLILCFRAEEKIEMAKVNGKLEVRKKESLVGKDGWIPICEKSVPFECTCSFLLLASNPGIPHPIKLQEQHKPFFSPTNAIDEYAGEQLAKWAMGGDKSSIHEPSVPEVLHDMQIPTQSLLPAEGTPADPYLAKLRTCERSMAAITATFNAIPEEIRQDCFEEYQKQLRALNAKGKKG